MPDLMEVMHELDGYTPVKSMRQTDGYNQRFKEAVELITNAKRHPRHVHEFMMREAMTTSDFPLLYADTVDRKMLATYSAIDPEWKKYLRTGTVSRLYPHIGAKRFAINGSNRTLDRVAEKGEYKPVTKTETKYDLYCYKYGNQEDISWEARLADDLNALGNTPTEFAWLAANTEHYLAVNSYANDVGTHAGGNLYEVGVNAGTLPLTIGNLEASISAFQAIRAPSGAPIRNRPKYLVISDGGLEFTARQILTSSFKMWLSDSDDVTPPAAYPTTNVISQYGLQLVIDPWLSIAGTTGYTDNTWYLFSDPNQIAAVECDYLEGHERPEIVMKASDKVLPGGGAVSPMNGDFYTDNILYRIRQCFGANKLDWRATYINTVAD